MINDINFFIQWYVNMSHDLWPHGPCGNSQLGYKPPYQSYRHFRASRETMASDPEGQPSHQSDIPANSEVSEVVINFVVSKDNLWRWCGLKITTRPSRCACRNIECASIRVCLANEAWQPRARGGYFLIRGQWGCAAAGWGRIFTSGLTIMGSHFQRVTRVRSCIFSFLGVRQFFTFTVSNHQNVCTVSERWSVLHSI